LNSFPSKSNGNYDTSKTEFFKNISKIFLKYYYSLYPRTERSNGELRNPEKTLQSVFYPGDGMDSYVFLLLLLPFRRCKYYKGWFDNFRFELLKVFTHREIILFKGTVSVISCDAPCKDSNDRFTKVPLKPQFDQKCGR